MKILKKILNYAQYDIWRISCRKLPARQSLLITQLRIFLLALRGFAEDKCQLRASALTFYTLMSIVPVAALAFGIAKGFGMEAMLERQLRQNFEGQEQVLERIIEFSHSMLENTKGGMIAGIGVVILFWAVIKLLKNIERSFNDIWGIKTGRSMGRKFSDYLAIMMVCPLLFILSSSLTVFISVQLEKLTTEFQFFGFLEFFVNFTVKIMPFGVIWLLFTFLYLFLPNTQVKFRAGLVAGIIGGTFYQFGQWLYIASQVGVGKYGAIYGSFAALPLFLVWLQISWLIVLFGAEIAFATQNVETYEFEPDAIAASVAKKRRFALYILSHIVKRFIAGEEPEDADELSHRLDLPIRLVRDILHECVTCKLLAEVKGKTERNVAYQPAMDPACFSIHKVLNTLNEHGEDHLPIPADAALKKLTDQLAKLDDALAKHPANVHLAEL